MAASVEHGCFEEQLIVLHASSLECVAGFFAASGADFGVAGDGAEAVVAEVVGGDEGVAEFVLDDGAGGVPEPVRVQFRDLVGGSEAFADGFCAAHAQAPPGPAGGVANEQRDAGVCPGA